MDALRTISPATCSELFSFLKSCKTPADVVGITLSILKLSSPVLSGLLTNVINASITTSTYPVQWKSSLVCPSYKGGLTSNCNNHWPTSLLPIASKVCKRIANDQLDQYTTDHHLLCPMQSGFWRGHSTKHFCYTLPTSGTELWIGAKWLELYIWIIQNLWYHWSQQIITQAKIHFGPLACCHTC